jgi:hypothetical protein
MESEQHFTVQLTREELHCLVKASMFANGFEPPDETELPALREVAARLLRLVGEERIGPIAVTIVPRHEAPIEVATAEAGLELEPVLGPEEAPVRRV